MTRAAFRPIGTPSRPLPVSEAFGDDVDYANAIKVYGLPLDDNRIEARYSPSKCKEINKIVVSGNPDPDHISTSFMERANLTMRMGMRRFTRLTNGFSKKFLNHQAAVNLHMMHYNFFRVHSSLRVTPAMAAGVSDHVWEIEEIVGLLDIAPRGCHELCGKRFLSMRQTKASQ